MPQECGNPLLRDWTKEIMDQQQGLQSKVYYTYKKAYDTLCEYPYTFHHPSEAQKLVGIGPKLVEIFEERMEKYCEEKGLPMPEKPGKKKKNAGGDDTEDISTPVKAKRTRPYVPTYRTGAYGILICLLEHHEVGRENIIKDQICRLAQMHCDSSYTCADPGKSYTAWSSMRTLIDKGFVYKNGSPGRHSLTETGVELAKKLKQAAAVRTNGHGASPPPSSRAIVENNEDIDEDTLMYKNPSTTRSSTRRKTTGSRTSDILSRMIDFDDDLPNELDMSLYVSNLSAHQSISINGKTSTNNNSAASRSYQSSSSDILQASAGASRTQKRPRANKNTGDSNKRQRKPAKKSPTAALMDSLLAEYDAKDNGPDMSQYVMNPSAHQSISLGGRTFHSKTANPAAAPSTSSRPNVSPNLSTLSRPGSASSITNSNSSAFAGRVVNAKDTDDYDDRKRTKKYTTPANSILLKNNKSNVNRNPNKRLYNVDDFEIDLSPPSLPTFKSPSVSSQLKIASGDIVDLLSSPSPSPSPTLHAAALDFEDIPFDEDFDTEKDYFPLSQQRTKQINNDQFHYIYLDLKGEEIRHVANAAIEVDAGNECLAYRIRFFTNQSDHPKAQQLIQVLDDDDHPGCSVGFISELHKDPIAPGLPAKPVLPLHREEPDNFWPSKDDGNTSSSQTSLRNDYNERLFSFQASSQLTSSQQQQQSSQNQTQQNEVNYAELVESESLDSILPHEYEVVLVLDSREIQMKHDRDYFQRNLAEKGVKCITRSMDLGDVIWIARKIGNTNQADELFLDYIVERKRLDDLVSSIKDGRFVEQKTRLKRSGSTKVVYIVEEYNVEDAARFGMQAIQTAMSSTQIIEGIYLKRTNSVDETIEYLVSATKLITRLYKDTTLYTIPGHIITRQNYLDLKDAYREKAKKNVLEKSAYLINYPMFGQLNTKNGSTTVHEVYLRMLMTIKGVNAERALSLIKMYPTPHSLLKAFHGKTIQEAKNMVKDATQHHISRRRWGVQISERLFQIWGVSQYPASSE